MKNLLITTAAVLLMLTMMGYWFELGNVVRTKAQLKSAADEAAATAALCIDAESFGEGILHFDQEEAAARAEESLGRNLPNKMEKVTWDLAFSPREADCPWVAVTLRYEKLKAVSVYEYVPLQ